MSTVRKEVRLRLSVVLRASLSVLLFTAAACKSAASVAPDATLIFTTPPDLVGSVSKAEFEGGNGPAGPYAQYNIWITVPPAPSANAGVVVPKRAPVFVRGNARLVAGSASDIRVGDQIQVWRDPVFVGYGSVEAPPGAPVYTAIQVVIVR